MENELLIFARNIAWLKEKNGLSNRQLAKRIRLGENSVRKLLRSDIPPRMSAEVIYWASKEFGYRPSELFAPLYKK